MCNIYFNTQHTEIYGNVMDTAKNGPPSIYGNVEDTAGGDSWMDTFVDDIDWDNNDSDHANDNNNNESKNANFEIKENNHNNENNSNDNNNNNSKNDKREIDDDSDDNDNNNNSNDNNSANNNNSNSNNSDDPYNDPLVAACLPPNDYFHGNDWDSDNFDYNQVFSDDRNNNNDSDYIDYNANDNNIDIDISPNICQPANNNVNTQNPYEYEYPPDNVSIHSDDNNNDNTNNNNNNNNANNRQNEFIEDGIQDWDQSLNIVDSNVVVKQKHNCVSKYTIMKNSIIGYVIKRVENQIQEIELSRINVMNTILTKQNKTTIHDFLNFDRIQTVSNNDLMIIHGACENISWFASGAHQACKENDTAFAFWPIISKNTGKTKWTSIYYRVIMEQDCYPHNNSVKVYFAGEKESKRLPRHVKVDEFTQLSIPTVICETPYYKSCPHQQVATFAGYDIQAAEADINARNSKKSKKKPFAGVGRQNRSHKQNNQLRKRNFKPVHKSTNPNAKYRASFTNSAKIEVMTWYEKKDGKKRRTYKGAVNHFAQLALKANSISKWGGKEKGSKHWKEMLSIFGDVRRNHIGMKYLKYILKYLKYILKYLKYILKYLKC